MDRALRQIKICAMRACTSRPEKRRARIASFQWRYHLEGLATNVSQTSISLSIPTQMIARTRLLIPVQAVTWFFTMHVTLGYVSYEHTQMSLKILLCTQFAVQQTVDIYIAFDSPVVFSSSWHSRSLQRVTHRCWGRCRRRSVRGSGC